MVTEHLNDKQRCLTVRSSDYNNIVTIFTSCFSCWANTALWTVRLTQQYLIAF